MTDTGTPELPSVGFHDRLALAMQDWERRHRMVGRRGGQAALVKRMHAHYGANAPTQANVSQWFRRETTPSPDGGVMLAYALEVRAEWLLLHSGPMTVAEPEKIVSAVQQTGARPMHPSQFRAAPEPAAKKKRRANGG